MTSLPREPQTHLLKQNCSHFHHTRDFDSEIDIQFLSDYPPLLQYAKAIGRTPLVEVPSFYAQDRKPCSRIFCKLEGYNPQGSIKARVAFALVYDFLKRKSQMASGKNRIKTQDHHLIEYTGGSLGLALSSLCSALQLPLTLVIPDFVSPEHQEQMRSEGTELVLVPSEKGFWAVMEKAFQLSQQNPQWEFLYQHTNPANLWIHRISTGHEVATEILLRNWPAPAVWVASIGTGGSLIGVTQALAHRWPEIKAVAVSPAELPYGSTEPPNGRAKIAGSGGLGCGRKQNFVEQNEYLIHSYHNVEYSEALEAVEKFYQFTGIKLGTSAAANWKIASQLAEQISLSQSVVFAAPSFAENPANTRAEVYGENYPVQSYIEKMCLSFKAKYINNNDIWSSDEGLRKTARVLQSHLNRGSRILDVGAGCAPDAEYLLNLGHEITLIDIVENSRWADLKNIWGEKVATMKMPLLDFSSDRLFDAILDNGCIHHQHPAQINIYLKKVYSLLKTDGLYALNVYSMERPTETTTRIRIMADGRFSHSFCQEELKSKLTEHSFEWVYSEVVSSSQHDGSYIIAIVRKK